jgi:hypothetical protein
MEAHCVLCEVWAESWYVMHINLIHQRRVMAQAASRRPLAAET